MKEASEAKTKQPPVPAAPSAESQAQAVTGETTAPDVKATKQQGASEREANIEYVTNMCKISLKNNKNQCIQAILYQSDKETRLNVCGIYYFFSFISIKKSNLNPLAKEFVMGKGREQVSILLQYLHL